MTVDLHPWNTDFDWRMPSAPPGMLTAEQLAQFDTHGFVVLQDVFDDETLGPIVAEIDEFEAETERRLRQMDGERFAIAEAGAITFTTHLVTRSRTLRAFVQRPELASLCRDLIGPDVRLYWDQAVYKKPEKPRRFPWHQDNGYAFVEPQQYLTCWITLNDATVDNGCPQVAPGWHRKGTLRTGTSTRSAGSASASRPRSQWPRCAPAASSCSPASRLTSPARTPAMQLARRTSCSTTPDGAVKLEGNPNDGPPSARTIQDDPERQFRV